ncbi:MAG: hypothetical protein ROR55_13485 [Devosia sp.]
MASGHTSDPADVMTGDDYSAPAEIFVSRRPGSKRSTLAYHRFATAAEAIAFAVEEFPSMSANGLVMTVQNKRFDLGALRTLHSASNGEPEDPGEGSSE